MVQWPGASCGQVSWAGGRQPDGIPICPAWCISESHGASVNEDNDVTIRADALPV